jgi:hypothetical protein
MLSAAAARSAAIAASFLISRRMTTTRRRSFVNASPGCAAQALPDGEQLGTYNASMSALSGRNGLLDERRVIVVAIVHEAEKASFHHFPELLDHLLRRDLAIEHGVEILLFSDKLEEAIDRADCKYGVGICRQLADHRIGRHVRPPEDDWTGPMRVFLDTNEKF